MKTGVTLRVYNIWVHAYTTALATTSQPLWRQYYSDSLESDSDSVIRMPFPAIR